MTHGGADELVRLVVLVREIEHVRRLLVVDFRKLDSVERRAGAIDAEDAHQGTYP
jgi:hypothetical protein